MFWFNAFIRTSQSVEDESAPGTFSEEDWERLNNIIGYKEGDEEPLFATHDRRDLPHTTLEIHMKHNASKLSDGQDCLADLSCDNLDCSIQLYSETKVFDIKLGSYQLLSPNGLIAEVCLFSIFTPLLLRMRLLGKMGCRANCVIPYKTIYSLTW